MKHFVQFKALHTKVRMGAEDCINEWRSPRRT